MIKVDFPALRSNIRDAARRAFETVIENHPGERFYAFALYSDDGAMTVLPAVNSEEALLHQARAYGCAPIPNWLRWSTAEWKYEYEGSEHFETAHEMLNVAERCNDAEFEAFRVELYETMVQALGYLDAENFFGTGARREAVTVFCSISDSEDAEHLENESARRLNSLTVYEKFKNRYIVDE